jgi:predicted transcriptional regulator
MPMMKSVFTNRKKRTREEIIASILFSTKQGATKTAIMYSNYLSFSQLNKYLEFSLKNQILYQNGDSKYFTSTKGLQFLECFEEVHQLENSVLAKKKKLSSLLESESLIC